ncbi:DUF1064 domain-containing protein [Azospirillum melinis]|uniref:DUF1064 domain-containing protein n=1 Tax=Azospirillum melinis TaxID=328839 RepID=UPI0037569043
MSRSARAIPLHALGPDALRQIDNVLFAEREREKLRAEKKANKYGAKRAEVDGIVFDSAAEARRWSVLKLEERAGLISGLERQVPYAITINGEHIAKWIADFRYVRDGQTVCEDVKGVRTPVYRLKAKLVQAIHGIRILETKA